jgi:hypothetical protein
MDHDHFGGLDVSVEETSNCIVDDAGRIVKEVKVANEPEALLKVLGNPAYRFKRRHAHLAPQGRLILGHLASSPWRRPKVKHGTLSQGPAALYDLARCACDRFGSIATEIARPRDVRFPPESDRTADIAACLKRARRRHHDPCLRTMVRPC